MMENYSNQRGFTILELLVSVGIVGILTSIVIPQVEEYRRRVYDVTAVSQVVNGRTALLAFSLEHDPTDVTNYSFNYSPVNGSTGNSAMSTLLPGFTLDETMHLKARYVGFNYVNKSGVYLFFFGIHCKGSYDGGSPSKRNRKYYSYSEDTNSTNSFSSGNTQDEMDTCIL